MFAALILPPFCFVVHQEVSGVKSVVHEAELVITEAEYRQLVSALRQGLESGQVHDTPEGYACAGTGVHMDALRSALDAAKSTTIVRVITGRGGIYCFLLLIPTCAALGRVLPAAHRCWGGLVSSAGCGAWRPVGAPLCAGS